MAKTAVLVTGATGGIGRAIIRSLYAGDEPAIIAACRHPERLDEIAAGLKSDYPGSSSELIPLRLDLASFRDVMQSAETILKESIRLRALINNAGTMPLRHHVTSDGYEEATQVNYLSTVLLTRTLLPALDIGSTIVFTVSETRHLTYPSADFDSKSLNARGRIAHFINYARSKTLLSHYALQLHDELKPKGINVCCSDPGVVDSGIITLGIPAIDRVADMIFRPLISTPAQGAAPALNAIRKPVSGAVFTSRHIRMLPDSWTADSDHKNAIIHTDRILNALIARQTEVLT